jgi:3-methylcrotonyl-CoA carboxylase alpha subunit
LTAALAATVVIGPRTNLAFLSALCRAPAFRSGDIDTGLIDANLSELGAASRKLDAAAAAYGVEKLLEKERARLAGLDEAVPEVASPWDTADSFQLSGARHLTMPIVADGEVLVAEVLYGPDGPAVRVDGVAAAGDAWATAGAGAIFVLRNARQTKVALRDIGLDEGGDSDLSGIVRAPMHGKVLGLFVEKGDQLTRGQRVAIIEAMKMEHTLVAPIDGIVAEVVSANEAQVAEGATILRIVPVTPSAG